MKRERSRALGSARQGRGRPVRPPLAAPPLRLSRTSRFLSLSLLFRASHCPVLCPRHGHTSAPVTASCTCVCLAVAACHLRVPNYALRIQNCTHASASARARAALERARGGCAGARLGGSGALRSSPSSSCGSRRRRRRPRRRRRLFQGRSSTSPDATVIADARRPSLLSLQCELQGPAGVVRTYFLWRSRMLAANQFARIHHKHSGT